MTAKILEPEELTYEEALTMAMLLGFEWQECEWCHGGAHHLCFQCIHTHWGCCGKTSREEAVWSYLVLKKIVTHAPSFAKEPDLWQIRLSEDEL